MACTLWRRGGTPPPILVDVRPAPPSRWYDIVNPRSRPHRERGPPWCVTFHPASVPLPKVCFVSSYPSVLDLATLLVARRIAAKGDAIVANENMAFGEEHALASMRRLAAEVANASTPLGRARRRGVRLLFREKSPQAFSDSKTGTFQHATYGARGQHCAVPPDTQRSNAVAQGLDELERAGVGVVRIWDQSVTQADQYLQSRTPYVASKLDCTHFCEPSGVLDYWSDATLRAIASHSASGTNNVLSELTLHVFK